MKYKIEYMHGMETVTIISAYQFWLTRSNYLINYLNSV